MFKFVQLLAFVTVVSASFVLGGPAFGAECLEVKVPDSVKAGRTDLVLNVNPECRLDLGPSLR